MQAPNMLDNLVSFITHYQVYAPDSQGVKQIQVSGQQATPSYLQQAFGSTFRIVPGEATSPASS
jgi:hypothetical protein